MTFSLNPKIQKLFIQEASVFSFEHQNQFLDKDLKALGKWLDDKAHAQMKFLENNLEARKNPNLILENTKSAIIFLFPYAYGKKVRARLGNQSQHTQKVEKDSLIDKELISKYVYGKDYHKVIKSKLNENAEKLKEFLQEDFSFRAVVDSIPFFDRAHAREASLGFVGKNTMLIRPGMGSFFFIATLLTSLPVEKLAQKNLKKTAISHLDCGTCTKCIEACPTNAIEENYRLNANKCLSYLSIEHRDIIDAKLIPFFKDTIYGCDICQNVCPYNAVTLDFPIIPEFSQYHQPFSLLKAEEIALMSPTEYTKWFGGTAATRAKYEGLVRNALYHLFATDHKNFQEICRKSLNSTHPLIQKTADQLLQLRVQKN